MKKILLISLIFLMGPIAKGQDATRDSLSNIVEQAQHDTAKFDAMLQLASYVDNADLNEAIIILKEALEIAEKIGYEEGLARANKAIGVDYYFLGNYSNALMHWKEAKTAFEKINDSSGLANILSNMGAVYYSQAKHTEAMALYLQSLKIAEELNDTMRMGTVLQNIGAIHSHKLNYERALEAYLKALTLFEAIEYWQGFGLASDNISKIYTEDRQYDAALAYVQEALNKMPPSSSYYFTLILSVGRLKLKTTGFDEGMKYLDSAYQIAMTSKNAFALSDIIFAIAEAHYDIGDNTNAINYFEKSKALYQKNNRVSTLQETASKLVKLYAQKGDYKKAYENQVLYQSIKDSIYNLESDKKIDQLLFNFDLDKKESEINLLIKDKEIQEIQAKRQKVVRNGFMGGFAVVLLFAGIFLAQRNRIGKEKQRSEELLLNILPEEVAEELKQKGYSDAKLLDQVTVLFTDFKDFASMSEQLSPQDLVKDLHECFSQFDTICERYGIEKIKTIGDSYMAAGGLPSPNTTHAHDTVMAALEMAEVVNKSKAEKIAANLPFCEVRIGINTGSVVAGIVGVKKFQYDIWGDTVNTASRMESSGEVGKVNITKASYELLKDCPDFSFENRGKIEAKGKGEMEMWFVKLKTDDIK